MDFYSTLKQTQSNISVTENGMEGFKTTYHPLLDMNFKVSSYRHEQDDVIARDIKDIIESNDASYLLKFLFYVRDVREGLGERRLFRVALRTLLKYDFENKDEIIQNLIQNQIQEYGRFDDLLAVFENTKYEEVVISTIHNILKQDWANMKGNKPISLLAKWLPSVNTSSSDTRKLANKLVKAFGINQKQYRKTLSALRNYLKVTETYTSANEWDKIDYNQVPSKANLKYNNAFLRHDEERRRDFLAALRVGVDKDGNKVKINSSVNFPHEIVTKYSQGYHYVNGSYDEALEQLWKNLKQMPGLGQTIVVRDGSGSMTTRIGSGNTSALDVATALSIYCAERLEGTFKDKFITFSSRAELVDLGNSTSLYGKLKTCYDYNDCSNTNIENVFDLILSTAIRANMPKEDMPRQILIISDMEFDPSRSSGSWGWGGFNAGTNVFINANQRFKQAGYELPKLVFWNVNSRTNTLPLTQNENGVVLVSGFSQNVLSMVLNGETDPFKAFIKELDKPRYNAIPLLTFVGKQTSNKTKSSSKTTKKDIDNINWL